MLKIVPPDQGIQYICLGRTDFKYIIGFFVMFNIFLILRQYCSGNEVTAEIFFSIILFRFLNTTIPCTSESKHKKMLLYVVGIIWNFAFFFTHSHGYSCLYIVFTFHILLYAYPKSIRKT